MAMPTDADPIPGNWYFNRDDDQRFRVVGLDDEEDKVEIQLADGNLDEIAKSRWHDLNIDPVEPVLNPQAPLHDVSDGRVVEYMADDPHAAHVPSDQERYRRRNVEFAGKARPGFPDPRPENGPDRGPERGSERGIEQWPEARDRE
jgi:hypothetical protein